MDKAAPSHASSTDRERALAQVFEQHRPALFGLAYRMLGSVAEAEDAVQDCYLRWRTVDPAAIRSERAWLLTATGRLCIDRLRSARALRETYIGPWLPEPVLTDADGQADWGEPEALASTLSTAMLLLLERLSPAERAAFLLYEVFDCNYAEIAAALDRNETSCRQLVHRSRARLQDGRARFQPDPELHRQLLGAFGAAVEQGDLAKLKAVLAEDATLHSDGGGRVRAARNVLYGADAVARFVLGVWRKRYADYVLEPRLVNGLPGLVMRLEGAVVLVLSLEVAQGRIQAVHLVNNPDKLRHLH